MEIWLFFSSIAVIIKDVYIFLNVVSDHKYTKILKLLAHLSVGVYIAVLPKGLYIYNLSLLEMPSCLITTAFYKVFIKFLFGLLWNLKVKK